jgi:hypothetical protein
MVPKAMQIIGCRPAPIPFSTPTTVYKPIPSVSNKNKDFLKKVSLFLKITARIEVLMMVYT